MWHILRVSVVGSPSEQKKESTLILVTDISLSVNFE